MHKKIYELFGPYRHNHWIFIASLLCLVIGEIAVVSFKAYVIGILMVVLWLGYILMMAVHDCYQIEENEGKNV